MIVLVWPARADEGMWLPFLLSGKQYNDMVSRGFRLTAEDLYSVNQASLKDAIVLFGRGCTGELVSAEGLLLTNHHCGYSRIQQHSSVAHDYLADGFWAMQKGEELPNPGLTASRLVRMQDVTAEMVKALNPQMSEKERSEAIKKKGAELAKKAVEGTHYEGEVKPFYYGNQFILIIMEVFKDVRLVGAPPSAIGKFGGDTDNWMWPRHTGDFSIFRIYAGKDNKPAPYDKENQPYKPEKFLEISLNGVSEGDFTMVYGFPAQTEQYLPAVAIRHLQQHIYPLTVAIRDKELEVINEAMASSQALRIMYAARQAGVANGWKKLKGVIPGLERYQVEDLKTAEEKILRGALDIFPLGRDEYIGVMEEYNKTYSSMLPYDVWQTAFNECFWKQPLFRFVFKGYWLPGTDQKNDKGKEAFDKTIEDIVKSISGTYKGMDMTTETRLMAALISEFTARIPDERLPYALKDAKRRYKDDYTEYTHQLFAASIFRDSLSAAAFFGGWKPSSLKKLMKDPVFRFVTGIVDYYRNTCQPEILRYTTTLDSLHRIHMRTIMNFSDPEMLYPDANSTLRITYGQVKGSEPRDAVRYLYRTTLDGILIKEDPEIEDYAVPGRLKEIAAPQFYGPYGDQGVMPVAFIATNHTTGGNSGSPVLDADGRLIGINFDRAWEGTMSDLHYEPEICRNISIDIRYLLFVVDRYAGAGHLIQEMVIHQ